MMKYVAITLQPIRIRLMFLLSSNAYFEYALNRIESCPNFALAPVIAPDNARIGHHGIVPAYTYRTIWFYN
jgi:hypothetical protein